MARSPQPYRGLTLLVCSLILCASLVSAGTVNLTWNASQGATSYQLYYGTTDGPPYQTVVETGAATQASLAGLTDGTRYYFAATASNEWGESDFSNEVNVLVGAPPQSAVAVNAAGPLYTAQDGTVYDADQWFTGGTTSSTTANISGTSDDPLYRTERYGNFSYSLPVQNGTYLVTLKFAEIYWTQRNRRIFDVLIEGNAVISNLDLYREVGKNRAYDRTFPVSVTDSVLTIQFRTDRDNAQVTAIKVVPQ